MKPSSNDNLDRATQFSLKAVFAVTTAIAIVLGAVHWLGIGGVASLVVVLLLVVGAVNIAINHKRFAAIVGFGLLGLMALAYLAGVLESQNKHAFARRAQCTHNLKQIGIALHNYADVYGCFPPSYVADADGSPMHSWRVLILTCYLAVTGPQTVWPGERGVAWDDISDGAAQTLAVVEVAHSGIHWMEPNDLTFTALNLGVNPPTGLRIGSEHPDVAQVLFCDGTVHALESTISVKTLKALATKSSGETIDEEY